LSKPSTQFPYQLTCYRGRPLPLGVTTSQQGLNFALLCRHGTSVTLVIEADDTGELIANIPLDPIKNRTGDLWHITVSGLPNSFQYGYRVDGPSGLEHRYDPSTVLLDPVSPMLSNGGVWGAQCEVDRHRTARRSLYRRGTPYDWGEDQPPRICPEDIIVYELHVRGFTCHPNSMVAAPGTFAGLVEKIPYLKWLGVNAVELLPIHEFDECDCPFVNPKTGQRNRNFWGYNSIAFSAPKASYAAGGINHEQIREFRDMVKAFHEAGIEVWLDVVFNHTGEGDDRGRTYSFRGLDNSIYYLLTPDGRYQNFSGTGNTLNCNHPLVRDLILQCLRFWVSDMHVDGFRFDLASILGRDRNGHVLVEPPVVEMISEDAVLRDTKLVAEPWDAAGLNHLGRFPFGARWSEWNGRYRDDIRRFWRGDRGMVGALATRLCGSSDLYEPVGRSPRHSINFVTCHDGFTLNDLVSYNRKHNLENGEDNRDGWDGNNSWNCGVEGPTQDPRVLEIRKRQAKNMMATLMLSQGVPMILAGDEFLRTQQGNNNAWCQDNEISWVDWSLKDKNADFLRFVREMIHFRKRHPVLRRRNFFVGPLSPWSVGAKKYAPAEETSAPIQSPIPQGLTPMADIYWHGVQPHEPDFSEDSRVIAFCIDGRFSDRDDILGDQPDRDIYVAINGSDEPTPFVVPASPTGRFWHLVVDTAQKSPADFFAEDTGPRIDFASELLVQPFSLVVLVTEAEKTTPPAAVTSTEFSSPIPITTVPLPSEAIVSEAPKPPLPKGGSSPQLPRPPKKSG
jgi:glycogen operon protein